MTELSRLDAEVSSQGQYEDRLQELVAENALLREALERRVLIEQAKGAASARLNTTPEVAFELMRGLARSQRRNLHEFAAGVVQRRGSLE
jgi:AmiR/NasT family two-component response regulator